MTIALSITGDLASGKSTLSKTISEKFELTQILVGNLVRKLAEDRKLDLLQANIQANKNLASNAWMDQEVDDLVKMKIDEMEARGENYIIDARVGFHYAPNSIKVKLITHPAISAERAYNATRQSENYGSFDDAYAALQLRRSLEKARFTTRYDIDIDNLENYDLIIDTSFLEPEHTAEIVGMVIGAKKGNHHFPKFWCHPGQIIPGGQASRSLDHGQIETLICEMHEGYFDYLEGIDQKALIAKKTAEGDLLLIEGHHRIISASVTSLPYIGINLTSEEFYPEGVLNRMYDNYEAMNYFAQIYAERHPDKLPFWGQYKPGNNDAALNRYKFNFPDRYQEKSEPGVGLSLG